MTIEEVNDVVKRVSYHGMLFSVQDEQRDRFMERDDYFVLHVRHHCIDSVTGEPIKLSRMRPIHKMFLKTEKDVLAWIWREVQAIAMHEAAEFFLIDGRSVHSPHGAAV